MVAQDGMDDLVVLGRVAGPVHLGAVLQGVALELLQVLIELGEGMLLDLRGQAAQRLPLGDLMHLAVPLAAQVPQPLVVELLVLGGLDETVGGFGLVDRPVPMDDRAARLRLRTGAHGNGRGLGMIEPVAVPDRVLFAVGDHLGV